MRPMLVTVSAPGNLHGKQGRIELVKVLSQNVGWFSRLNDESFCGGHVSRGTQVQQIEDGTTKGKVTQVIRLVIEACDVTVLRRRLLPSRQPNYWWNTEIACFRARRLYQRLRGNPSSDGREEKHKQLRGRLRKDIRRSKKLQIAVRQL